MKDEDFNRQLDRIRPLADKWITPLGLKWWRKIDIHYSDTPKENSPDCVADTHVLWEYMEATITFYLLKVETISDADLEYSFVHECMHILVQEMRWQDAAKADNIHHEERVCTSLARGFLWTRDAAKAGQL